MSKKRPPFNQEMAIRGANRRLFARSPLVREKQDESRQEFPRYKKDGTRAKKNWVKRQCEVCNEWVSSTQIQIDHIDPVVPKEGFSPSLDLWDRITIFLKRLWCDKSNLQRICTTCHKIKTDKEKLERMLEKDSIYISYVESKIDTMNYENLHLCLKKFTTKKLLQYPEDLKNRVVLLKEKLNSIKPQRKTKKGR